MYNLPNPGNVAPRKMLSFRSSNLIEGHELYEICRVFLYSSPNSNSRVSARLQFC